VLEAAAVRAGAAGAVRCEHLPPPVVARLGERAARAAAAPAAPIALPTLDAAPAREGGAPTREELCEALEREGGNIARLAELYGKDRQQIYRWARRYAIDLDSYRK
jgi:transcriptional regulator of acetoin/glycerol metabolism